MSGKVSVPSFSKYDSAATYTCVDAMNVVANAINAVALSLSVCLTIVIDF